MEARSNRCLIPLVWCALHFGLSLIGHASETFGYGTVITPTTASGGSGSVANLQTDDDTEYVVAKSASMTVGEFGAFGSPIHSVYLFAQYSVDSGYGGTNALKVNGIDTTIVPADRDYGRWAYTEITGGSFGIDTSAEIESMTVTFTNNDNAAGDSVFFDCVCVVVNPQTAIPIHPTWLEDFNGTGQANPLVWNYEVGYKRNKELQYYVPGATNGWQEGGNFIIEGRKDTADEYPGYDYTSASIVTANKYYWQFGRARIRAQIPAKAGMWPAIWGTGETGQWPHNGEVDIMEYYQNKILANCAVGTTQEWTAKWDASSRTMTSLTAVDPGWKTQWHIWTMQWDDQNVRLYADNILMNTIPQTWLKNTDGYNTSWGPQYPFLSNGMSCWLNLAMGGAGGDPAQTMNSGPQRYLIDYWKIWEGATGNVAPTDMVLDSDTVAEGLPAGTVVGNLTAPDADPAEVHRYTLVTGTGSTHNSQFAIPEFVSDNTLAGVLMTAAVLDAADGPTRSIRVRVTDIEGATCEKVLTVHVTSVVQQVSYDGNGNTGGSVPVDDTSYESGSTVTVLGNTGGLTRTGYTFTGWNTAADGSGTGYVAGNTFTITGNTWLHARWIPNDYTVTFDANGGDPPSPAGMSVTYDSAYGPLASASRTGYTFAGWFTSASGGSEVTASTTVAITADQTLYAHWNATPVVDAGPAQTIYMTGSDVAWTPADAATLAWYDADDASTITQSGGAVSQWDDKSGNACHMKQSNVTYQPVYTASDSLFGGRPSISTGPAYRYLTMDQTTVAVKRMYLVACYGDGTQTIWTNHNAIVGSVDGSVRLTGRTNGNKVFDGNGDTKNFDYNGTTSRNGSTVNTNGQVAGLPINNELFTVTAAAGKTARWRLLGNNATYTLWDGGLAEIIFTDGTETLETQRKIEGYLAWKWGIQGKLSAAHPYSTTNATSGPKKSFASATATLAGSVTDSDDTPAVSWSDTGTGTGTGSVIFANGNMLDTYVTFTDVGTYVLRLTANDGVGSAYDDVVITVTDVTGPGPVDHFTISPIDSPQTVGTPITGVTLTAKDASNNTATGFNGTVTFGGTGGFSGTSANFIDGALGGVSVTPTVAGSDLTFTVDDGGGQTGSVTIATIRSIYDGWAAGPFANPFTDISPGGNPDGDSLTNLQEFAFGTDPTVPAFTTIGHVPGGDVTTPGLPLVRNMASEGVDYRAVFGRRKDHAISGLAYTVQFSVGLDAWVVGTETPTILTGAESGGEIEAVSVPFPVSIPTDSGFEKPTFFRVGVSQAAP